MEIAEIPKRVRETTQSHLKSMKEPQRDIDSQTPTNSDIQPDALTKLTHALDRLAAKQNVLLLVEKRIGHAQSKQHGATEIP